MDSQYEHLGHSANTYEQVLYILYGGAVKRFHNVPCEGAPTVGHHSFHVAMLCYTLTHYAPTPYLLLAALAHDMPEQIYGDIPAPAKRMANDATLAEAESRFNANHNTRVALSENEARILHLADKMAGMLECAVMRGQGNRFVIPVYEKFCSYIKDLLKTNVEREVYDAIERIWNQANG